MEMFEAYQDKFGNLWQAPRIENDCGYCKGLNNPHILCSDCADKVKQFNEEAKYMEFEDFSLNKQSFDLKGIVTKLKPLLNRLIG